MRTKKTYLTILLLILAANSSHGQQTAKQQAVINTLDAFHQAIVENNTSNAEKLLADSARILEGGKIETKEEYLSHHFHSDGKFLRAMKREIESRTVTIEGNTAWVSTRTLTRGTYNENTLELDSLELAVLIKKEGNWNITALHWSSARRD